MVKFAKYLQEDRFPGKASLGMEKTNHDGRWLKDIIEYRSNKQDVRLYKIIICERQDRQQNLERQMPLDGLVS